MVEHSKMAAEYSTNLGRSKHNRRDTLSLRKNFLQAYKKPSHLVTSVERSVAATVALRAYNMRQHQNTSGLHEIRVSERGQQFLNKSAAYRDNLSTPKYFTKLNTRQTSLLPSVETEIRPGRYTALSTPRISIPKYQVPAHLPELAGLTTLIGADNHKAIETNNKMEPSRDIYSWMELLERPVSTRPSFNQPIICKTPTLNIHPPDYQRPIGGFFKGVTRKTNREFIVHPEFVSETLKLHNIQGQSSNPLKYGWAG